MGYNTRCDSITFTGDNIMKVFEFCSGAQLLNGKLSVITTKGMQEVHNGDVIKRGAIGFEVVSVGDNMA